MSFTGMNIEEVRSLATQLNAKAEEIRGIMSTLTNALQGTNWVGPDRERYVSEWQSHHVTALNSVINGLQTAAQAATANASEQEAASQA